MNAECEQEGFYGGEEEGLKRKGFVSVDNELMAF